MRRSVWMLLLLAAGTALLLYAVLRGKDVLTDAPEDAIFVSAEAMYEV